MPDDEPDWFFEDPRPARPDEDAQTLAEMLAVAALNRRLWASPADHELDPLELEVLAWFRVHFARRVGNPVTKQDEIARALGVDRPTVAHAIGRLRDHGLLRVRTDPTDRRRRRLMLNPGEPLDIVHELAVRGREHLGAHQAGDDPQ